jgi:RNA polymerase sigma-70 factor, ECF subfamily
LRHEEQFFEEFCQANYGRTVALLAAITGSRHEAQDVAQQVYARALARWSRLRGYGLAEPWVRKVALRIAIDARRPLRRNLAGAVRLARQRRPADPESADDLKHTSLGVALLSLPLPERQVMALHYVADLPVHAIAAECDLAVGTVKTRLEAARRHLDAVLQENELRDQFEEWAEPLRATPAPAVAALRSRIRRRTARTAVATGSALAIVGLVAGLLVAGGSGKPGGPGLQAAGSAYPAPPGQPFVFVNSSATFVDVGDVPAAPAELRNAATGKVIKVLRPVRSGVSFSAATAAPGDRLFVLAQQDSDGTLSFAEVRIGASGKAGALRQVLPDLPMPAGTQVASMVVNAPGTRLSFAACSPTGLSSGRLVVYNLQTGTLIGSWPVASSSCASSQFLGDGNNMVASIGTGHNRLVDTTTPFHPGSSLLADSRPYGVVGAFATLTQDGNIGMDAVGGNGGRALLVEVSAASGKVLRRIPIGPSSAANGPYFCGVLWASANGHEVRTQCGTTQLVIVGGHATRIRLAWLLPGNNASGGNEFAW